MIGLLKGHKRRPKIQNFWPFLLVSSCLLSIIAQKDDDLKNDAHRMKNHIIILHTATKNSKRLNFGKKIFWNLFGEEEEKGMISK